MSYLSRLIEFCKKEYEKLPFCEQCRMVNGYHRGCGEDCYNCLSYIHRITTSSEHYACHKIIHNYILKHGNQFASEIAKGISEIEGNFYRERPVKILSLGCGPSTELFGAVDALKGREIWYVGFDKNDIWEPIQRFNCDLFDGSGHTVGYSDQDFLEFMEMFDADYDMLILNYFFSDFIKYSPNECDDFIKRLSTLINNGRFRYVVINDVSLFYSDGTGYSCIERLARELKTSKHHTVRCKRYHFRKPNEFQPTYGKKLDESLCFTTDQPELDAHEPFTSCRSILFVSSIESNAL